MRGFIAAIHFFIATLIAWSLFAAEPDPRLVELAKQKQRLEYQAERGRLLMENAELKYNNILAQERAIRAEKKAEK